ncbi:hypothetical protein [Klebsiella pneumoniae]|uniref:hypothetical protein n=1 Tax=Klebsiella pneumoniae TaxID=573 RepID=UPI001E2A5E94|nr:hypothetical protein [Klebsiella pneumoniae]MCC4933882.1 hypothetical protein [Klebsiella pneumoniae]
MVSHGIFTFSPSAAEGLASSAFLLLLCNCSFSVGNVVPVLGQVSYADNRPIQSTEYRSSGVILDVKPQIRTDSIDLVIKQQLSSFAKTDILVVLQAKKVRRASAAHAPSFHEERAR